MISNAFKSIVFLTISRLKRQNAIFLTTKQCLSFTAKDKALKNCTKLKNCFRHSLTPSCARNAGLKLIHVQSSRGARLRKDKQKCQCQQETRRIVQNKLSEVAFYRMPIKEKPMTLLLILTRLRGSRAEKLTILPVLLHTRDIALFYFNHIQ